MPWLKKHYDRVLLICSALLLIAVSVLLFLNSQSFAEAHDYEPTVAIVKNTAQKNNNIAPMPVAEVAKVSELASHPAQWVKGDLRLVASHIKFLRDGKVIPLDDDSMLHPPIPNVWIQKYEQLSMNDSDLLTQDTDKDGFSTLDEWLGEDPNVPVSTVDRKSTNPVDAKSHPAYHTKLFLNRIEKPKLLITFESVPGPGSFTFNTGPGTSSQILEMGSIISEERPNQEPRKRFKIIGYNPKKEKHPTLDMDVDVSEVMLLNEETKTQHALKVGETMDSPDSYAVFDYLWDKSNFTVKQGTEFELKPDAIRYKLIDIGEDKAVIVDVKSGTSLEIRKRSPQP